MIDIGNSLGQISRKWLRITFVQQARRLERMRDVKCHFKYIRENDQGSFH
jgi:hypothetical protein